MRIPKSLYYYYDNRWFDLKWHVLDYAHTQGHHDFNIANVRCVLNKNFAFDNIDWTKEPKKSWEQMTYERMMSIRDSHPKICLWYSGGSDSHYILELCLRHNIKLDEICINKTSFQNFPNDWFNHDVEKYALPFVKKYASHIPIYVNDMSDWGIWGEDNLLSFDNFFGHNGIFCSNNSQGWHSTAKEYSDRGFIMIHGATEPHVHYDKDNKKYFADLWDTDNFLDRNSLNDTIAFFTDPAVPEIHIKQCHMVKNYLRANFIPGKVDSFTNYDTYKDIYCSLTRNKYRVPEASPHFTNQIRHPIFGTTKQQVFISSLAKADKRIAQKYYHFLHNSVRGVPLFKQPRGVRIGKFYLE